MNTWRSNTPTKLLSNLWHRFNIWRAKRMYRWVDWAAAEAERRKAKADRLMRRHAEDPQQRLDLGDD